MEQVTIRRMVLSDLDQVMGIEEASFSSPWSHASFIHEIAQNPRAVYIVAVRGDRIVGYAGMWVIFDEGHITNVAVHPQHRRTGIARMLLAELTGIGCAQGVLRYTLEVRVSNIPAQTLYIDIGFRVAGTRKRYYQDNNEDAYIMWLDTAQEKSE